MNVKKTSQRITLLEFLCIPIGMMVSCVPTRHMPTLAAAAFFEQKSEYRVETGFTRHPEVNGAYAITDHFSVQATFGLRPYKTDYQQWVPDTAYVISSRTSLLYQGGVGFQFNPRPKLVFENYLGAFYSQTSRRDNLDYVHTNSTLETFDPKQDSYAGLYLNPSLGHNGTRFRWGYMHKISFIVANNPDYAKVFMEPTAFIGFGKNLKCNLQLAFPLTERNDNMQPLTLYGGISLSYQLKK